jgi:Cu/Ag efflux protein CusF
MQLRTGLKTVGLVIGFSSVLFAAEVSRTEYRAPKTESPRAEVTTRASAQATVEKIDYKTRMITIKNDAGETSEMKAGPEIQRFNEIKKGDVVLVDYVESQALYVKKAGKDEKPAENASQSAQLMEGKKPGIVASGAEQVSAEVVKVDYKARKITLKAADGTVSTMNVPAEVKRLDEIKKGDHIVAERTVAVAIAVRKPEGK